MKKYNVIEWSNYFEKTRGKVDPSSDFLLSNDKVLYPGRFYVLEYMAKTQERFNTRPVILSLGISKKDPESFLCIDLSVIPIKARLRFIEMFFKLYEKDLMHNMEKYPSVEDADEQEEMKNFTYDNICKAIPLLPVKYAIKRYKIENTIAIYSVPFFSVYKIIGSYCDENYYKNGQIGDVQKEFFDKMQKLRK